MDTSDSSTFTLLGGTIDGNVSAANTSNVVITSGSVQGYVSTTDQSIATLSGGDAWQGAEICLALAQRYAAAFVDLDTRGALDAITR